MLEGTPTKLNPAPLILHRFLGVAAPVDGIWKSYVEKGERIKTGQTLGEMQDFFGNTLALVSAPEDAAILGVMTIPPRPEGSMLMGIGTLT